MASAQTAYRYDYAHRHAARPASPSIHVVPGSGRHAQTSSRSVVDIARIALIVLAVICALGFVRIGFTAATINASFEGTELRNSINASTEMGKDLEVQATKYSDSTYLKSYGKKNLKMVEPANVENLVLPADVVAVDAAGNLSLSESLSVAAAR